MKEKLQELQQYYKQVEVELYRTQGKITALEELLEEEAKADKKKKKK